MTFISGDKISKESQRCYIYPVAEKPPMNPICTKICSVVLVPDIITYTILGTENFGGYDFTEGRIFDFPIGSCMSYKMHR